MNPLRSIIYIIGIVAVLTSCQGGNNRVATLEKGDTVRFDYATLLTVVRYSDHTHVEIANPWVKGSVLRSYDLSRPLGKAVATSPFAAAAITSERGSPASRTAENTRLKSRPTKSVSQKKSSRTACCKKALKSTKTTFIITKTNSKTLR